MVNADLSAPPIVKSAGTSWFSRVLKYTLTRTVVLFLSVAVSLYLTILVLNLGGHVDDIFRSLIEEDISAMIKSGWLRGEPEEVRQQEIDEMRRSLQHARGLDQPFLLRSLNWLWDSMTLELGGRSNTPLFLSWSQDSVQAYALRHLPYTLAVVGTGNVLVFFSSLFFALLVSRRHNSILDRLFILLTPFTSAPSWIHGILLVMLFAGALKILPFPRSFTVEPTEYSKEYFLFLLPYLALPVMAVFTSLFFQSVYSWRNFFLLYRDEPYVEVAQAKGLSSSVIERRYILRPTLPYVLTNFTMQLLGMWQGAIALEMLFYWPGIAALFLSSVRTLNTPLSLAIVVIFAYLLALSVWVLDVLYALVDPRVQVGSPGGGLRVKSSQPRRRGLFTRHPPLEQPSRLRAPLATRWRESLTDVQRSLRQHLVDFGRLVREILRSPAAAVGAALILILVITALATTWVIPYDQAVSLWRSEGGDWYRSYWHTNPRSARPAWINFFRRDKLPETIFLNSQDAASPSDIACMTGAASASGDACLPEAAITPDAASTPYTVKMPGAVQSSGSVSQETHPVSEGITETVTLFQFAYPYTALPDEMVIYLTADYEHKSPYVSYRWITPDGREIDLGGRSVKSATAYYVDQDKRLQLKLKNERILDALFLQPVEAQSPGVVKGVYQLRVSALMFEPENDVAVEVYLYGKVHGLAGSDTMRRDLLLALLWGLPVALVFGFLGAILTNLVAMSIAAFSAWRGGWADGLIQRITEVNLMIPVLPIAILVYMLYSKSVWVILGVVVLLNIFGSAIKNYRAVFLQLKESPYIEAARAYGASDARIIRRYLLPHILPVLVPQIVIAVPGYVFYEATLAYLGVSDPYLPTWGKVIYDAISNNALVNGQYYWLLEPVGLLLITALAFVLLGFSLERVLNPRLRET